MKRILIIVMFLFLTTPLIFAQYEEEEFTEEEAVQLIAAYETREREANEMAEEEMTKIEILKKQLDAVEKEIAEIEEKLRETKGDSEED